MSSWKVTPIVYTLYNTLPVELHLDDVALEARLPWPGSPQWLLVCKTFLHEELDELQLISTKSIGRQHRNVTSIHVHWTGEGLSVEG